jgi:hypothetical protein
MLPRGTMYAAHLVALASAAQAILAYGDTPNSLRREIKKFYRKLRKRLPPDALRQVEAAEAKATIEAANHLRRGVPDS